MVEASSTERVPDPSTEAQRRRLSEAPCPPPAGGETRSSGPAPPTPPPAPLPPFPSPPPPVECSGSPSSWEFFTIDPAPLEAAVQQQQESDSAWNVRPLSCTYGGVGKTYCVDGCAGAYCDQNSIKRLDANGVHNIGPKFFAGGAAVGSTIYVSPFGHPNVGREA